MQLFNIEDEDMPDMMDSDKHDLMDVTKITDDIDMLTYQIKPEFAQPIRYTSSVYGAITTAGGK